MRSIDATPAFLTIAYLVPICVWWFVQVSMMSQPASPPLASFSVQVLQALVLTQVLCLCLFVPHWAAASVAAALLPAWPLLAMLGFAAGMSIVVLAAVQAFIALIGLIIVAAATLLHHTRISAEVLRLLLSGLGVVAFTFAWLLRTEWLQWVTP